MSEPLVSDKARRWVVLLGVVSLVASVVALVWGRKLTPRPISQHDSYGRAALNTRVFVDSLPRIGIGAERSVDIERIRAAEDPVVFLAPDSPSQTIDGSVVTLESILAERLANELVSVVVLPKWQLDPLGRAEPQGPAAMTSYLEATGLPLGIDHVGKQDARPIRRPLTVEELGVGEVELPYPQVLHGAPVVLAAIAEGAIVVANEEETLYVVSDSDLCANFDVARAGHADLLTRLLERAAHRSRVIVDETFHGRHQEKSLAEALGEWPGVLVLVHGALLVLCTLLSSRHRFGPPRAAVTGYGRGPAEAIAVAADVLTLGRSPHRLATRYVELVIRDVYRKAVTGDDGHRFTTDFAAMRLDRLAESRKQPREAEKLLVRARSGGAEVPRRQRMKHALELSRMAYDFRRRWLFSGAEGDSP